MAAKLGTPITFGSEIAATGWSFFPRRASLCLADSTKTRTGRGSFAFGNPNFRGAPFPLPLQVSSGPNPTDNPNPSTLQDDLNYVLNLAAGSILGAGLIKYGSILIPDITRPNIFLALLMVFAPVLVAVLLLLQESSKE